MPKTKDPIILGVDFDYFISSEKYKWKSLKIEDAQKAVDRFIDQLKTKQYNIVAAFFCSSPGWSLPSEFIEAVNQRLKQHFSELNVKLVVINREDVQDDPKIQQKKDEFNKATMDMAMKSEEDVNPQGTSNNREIAQIDRDTNLPKVLSLYEKRLEMAAKSSSAQATHLPIDELALYLRVLNAMYEETIARYQRSGTNHEYVQSDKTEFAGELAYHPRFEGDAYDMLRASFEGAFRVLGQNDSLGGMDSATPLDRMMSIMSRLVEETSIHPAYREMALSIINDPKTYGLEGLDLSDTDLTTLYPALEVREPVKSPVEQLTTTQRGIKAVIGGFRKLVSKRGKSVEEISPAAPEHTALKGSGQEISPMIALKSAELAVVSNGLITAMGKKVRDNEGWVSNYRLDYRVEGVIRARTRRLLILANGAVNDDPQLAEVCLREYLRLLSTYGDRMKFYVDVTLNEYSNIMTNTNVRPTVLEIIRSIPEKDDRVNTLAQIALQFIREGNLQGALNLLKEAGVGTFSTFAYGLEIMIDRLLVPKGRNEKMIKELVKTIDDIPNDIKGRVDECKVRLLVRLAEAYDKLGMKSDARSYYAKAWEASGNVAIPAMTRLEYFVPLMRKNRITFPVSRDTILRELRVLAENDLNKPYPDEHPNKMIALAREYAFNRDYQKAEEAAQFINDHMRWPRDHYDRVYGAIVEAAALYGDEDMLKHAASKMTNYKIDHLSHAAQLLVDRGDYVRAMEIGEGIVTGWELTQIKIASFILNRDKTQIGMVRTYLEKAIEGQRGLDNFDLEGLVNLIADYPALDPDGQFILKIFKIGFEKNRDGIKHWSHRIILQNLRRIIMDKVREVNPNLLRITDVFSQVNGYLPTPSSEVDKAQLVDKGGIDLTPANMNVRIQNKGGEIKFHLNPAMLAQLQNALGFVPVIISIQLMTNLRAFLGLTA